MNILFFLLLIASFALCLVWYIQNFERRSDGESGWMLALKPDGDEDKKIETGELLPRGAEAVKQRAEQLGVAKQKIRQEQRLSRAQRVKKRTAPGDEKDGSA